MPDAKAPVAVRRLRDADRAGWSALWRGYLSFYRAEITDAVSARSFERLRDGEQGMLGLIAVGGDEQPLGLAHLVFHPATWSAVDHCYLEDLYVDRAGRGGQVARALFDAVYATARERGSERVYWHTQQYNGAARSLYDQVGQPTSLIVYERDLL